MPTKGQPISEEHREALRAWHRGQVKGQSPTKHCPRCRATKPRSDFGLRGQNSQGKRYSKSYCKECENLISTTKARGNPETITANNAKSALRRYFNMEPEDFAELNQLQNGVCAICDNKPVSDSRLHIDHDHSSGIVRGLLCSPCNLGLGNFLDNPKLLMRAIEYLASEPIALNDGTTFYATAKKGQPATHLSADRLPPEDKVLIAEQLRAARGGRTKASIAKKIDTTPGEITRWESRYISKVDMGVLFDLLEFYEMTSAVTERGHFIVFYNESMAAQSCKVNEDLRA